MSMNAAELKLDLFRRLDSLDSKKLEHLYTKIIGLINAEVASNEALSPEIKKALDAAIETSEKGNVHTHESVMQKTRELYPNLFR
ncbi:MAG TPA: hypothetical protein PK784_00430 [Tenuifilaceae bacterium]|nr:hypothetical protein [Tenuifilaceae bacterium]HPN23298.1 hypothetical protein [Tenuifilaceae bacterium]